MLNDNYFYVIVCDNKIIDTVYCLTLDLIDSCSKLAKQGHWVVIKKARIRK